MSVGADCGVAVVLGAVSGNLVGLDLDRYRVSGQKPNQVYVLRSKKELELIERIWHDYKDVTYAQLTPRGYRLFFTCDVLPPNREVASGVDIKAEAHYVVLAPSLHPSAHLDTVDLKRAEPYYYAEYNSLPVLHVEGSFYESFCALYDLKAEREAIDILRYIEHGVRLDDNISRNYVTLAVTEWFYQKGYGDEQCIQKALEVNAKSDAPDKEADVVKAAKYQLKKHYTIKFVQDPTSEVTLEDLDVELNYNLRAIDVAGGATEDFVYEGIKTTTRDYRDVWVLIWRLFDGGEVGATVLKPEHFKNKCLTVKGKTYPIRSVPNILPQGAWTPKEALTWVKTPYKPDVEAVYESVRDTYAYFVDCDQLGEYAQAHKASVACFKIATYFYELFGAFPYDAALGTTGSGKTTHMKAGGYQAYHAHQVYAVPSAAIVFRLIANSKAYIMHDNAENMYDKAKMSEDTGKIAEMYDVGFSAGAVVPRIEGETPSGDRLIKEWTVYGPKAFTSVMGFVPSLLTRSVITHMVMTCNDLYNGRSANELFINPRTPDDAKAAVIQKNRNDLYALRMLLWADVREAIRSFKVETTGLTARNWDLWLPILVTAKLFCPQMLGEIVGYANYLAKEKVLQYASEVNEAMIRTLIDLAPQEGWVLLSKITQHFNALLGYDNASGRRQLNERAVTDVLSVLGFTGRRRVHEGTQVYVAHYILVRYANMLGEKLGAPKTTIERVESQIRLRKGVSAPLRVHRSTRKPKVRYCKAS